MRINVHIERLILDGLPVTTTQGTQLQASIEREWGRLLAANGLRSELMAGGAMSHLPASAIQFANDAAPARLGHQIAQAVHGRIGSDGANDVRHDATNQTRKAV